MDPSVSELTESLTTIFMREKKQAVSPLSESYERYEIG